MSNCKSISCKACNQCAYYKPLFYSNGKLSAMACFYADDYKTLKVNPAKGCMGNPNSTPRKNYALQAVIDYLAQLDQVYPVNF